MIMLDSGTKRELVQKLSLEYLRMYPQVIAKKDPSKEFPTVRDLASAYFLVADDLSHFLDRLGSWVGN